jgi:hypothetical protein
MLNSMVVAMLLGVAASAAQTDPRAIMEYSVQAIEADWKAAPDYECVERDRETGGSKTFQDLMIEGSPYQRLVALNEKPLSFSGQKEQQQRLQATIAMRRKETAQQRAQRIAKYSRSRERDHLFLEQLIKAFNFSLVGQQELEGYQVYILKALPRPNYQPPTREAEVLKGMQGTLWIDKTTYQWVRVEARVTRPVWIEGFVAKVEPGTEFELDKMPVGDDIWLPKHYVMKARAKILFLFNHSSGDDDTYYNCRRIAPGQGSSLSK